MQCLVKFIIIGLRKLTFLLLRLVEIFYYFPMRLGRLLRHLGKGANRYAKLRNRPVARIGFWWLETLLYLLDLIGFAEIYEALANIIKFNTRPLYGWEIELGKRIYGESIRWQRVRLDEAAWIGPRQFSLCYVSGFTINSWGPMNNALLIHELMHVWQYQQMGLVYIVHALRAYHSEENYNYGGLEKLREVKATQKGIWVFNLEQQADIMSDYYRLSENQPPQWGNAHIYDLPVYAYFIEQVQRG
ncbi:MAG TPA: hypothetical protein VJ953_14345 [Saprospiraceae bacterium]|nr:hypothetical protein [Saprospiraceae bacterium]